MKLLFCGVFVSVAVVVSQTPSFLELILLNPKALQCWEVTVLETLSLHLPILFGRIMRGWKTNFRRTRRRNW